VGLGSLAVLFLSVRFLPRMPAALLVLAIAGAASALLALDARGVAVLGPLPAGLPRLRWPTLPLDELGYAGWVGCEYRPIAETRAGLAWAQRWGVHTP
jgi:MFS superfamily sulfate permease-like transporter